MNNPDNLHIAYGPHGYFIEDDYGDDVTPWGARGLVQWTREDAEACLAEMLDNYDGPPDTGDAWTGGFADNH